MSWFDDEGIEHETPGGHGGVTGGTPSGGVQQVDGGEPDYQGPLPAGYTREEVNDFLKRNRGHNGGYDYSRVMSALNDKGGSKGGGLSSMANGGGGVGGAPDWIHPFGDKFSAPDPSKLLDDPAIKYQLQQGQSLIENNAAASGKLRSPKVMKRLNEMAQGIAAQGYADLYNRALGEYDRAFDIYKWNEGSRYDSQRMNRLDDFGIFDRNRMFDFGKDQFDWQKNTDIFGMNRTLDRDKVNDASLLAGMGNPSQIAGAGSNYANAASDIIEDQGNAQAAGQVGSSNAWANGITGAGNTVTSLALMRSLRGRTPDRSWLIH